MPTDIRQFSDEEYWEELRRRWGGLLSYRYLGRRFASMNANVTDESMVLRHDMRNPAGGIRAAVLGIACPSAGGPSDLQAVPNPVVTSIQVLDDARDVRAIEVVEPTTLKVGSRLYFGRARIVDADDHGRTIALVDAQGAAIGEVPDGLVRFEDEADLGIVDSPELPPLWQVFGCTRRPDGSWALPELLDEHASPDAALHLGPQQVLLETAALEAAGQAAGTDLLQVESWHVSFLARGKVGPFRADALARLSSDGTRVGVQVAIVDEGAEGRNVTSASGVYRLVG
jgi:hypothetical protein